MSSLDFGGASQSALSGLASATPFGAAANVLSGALSGGPSSTAGDVSTGAVSFGPLNIAGIGSSSSSGIGGAGGIPTWLIIVGVFAAFLLLRSK